MNKQLDIAVKALQEIAKFGGGSMTATRALVDIQAITSSNETSAVPDVDSEFTLRGYRIALHQARKEAKRRQEKINELVENVAGVLAYLKGESPATSVIKMEHLPMVEPRVGTRSGAPPGIWYCDCDDDLGWPESEEYCSRCGALRPPLPVEAAQPVKVGVWLRGGIWVCACLCLSKYQHLATVERCPDCHWVRPGPNGESPTQTEQVPSSEQVAGSPGGGGDSPCECPRTIMGLELITDLYAIVRRHEARLDDLCKPVPPANAPNASGEDSPSAEAEEVDRLRLKVDVQRALYKSLLERVETLEQAIGALYANSGQPQPAEGGGDVQCQGNASQTRSMGNVPASESGGDWVQKCINHLRELADIAMDRSKDEEGVYGDDDPDYWRGNAEGLRESALIVRRSAKRRTSGFVRVVPEQGEGLRIHNDPAEQAITPEPEATRSVPLPEQELEQASSVSQDPLDEEVLSVAYYLEENIHDGFSAFKAGAKYATKASKNATSAASPNQEVKA